MLSNWNDLRTRGMGMLRKNAHDDAMQAWVDDRELVGIYFGCVALLLFAEILSFWHLTPPLSGVLNDIWQSSPYFMCFGLAASNVLAWQFAANARQAWFDAGFAFAVAVACLFATSMGGMDLNDCIFLCLVSFGMAGLLVLLYRARQPGGRKRFFIALSIVLYLVVSSAYTYTTVVLRPQTRDLSCWAFDSALGLRIAPYFVHLFSHSFLVQLLCSIAYIALVGAYVVLLSLQMRADDRRVVPALRLFLIVAVIGLSCYFLFPVVGPKYFFGGLYPDGVPPIPRDFPVGWHVPQRLSIRNGVPSLHFTWALLLVLNVPKRMRHVRAAYWLFWLLTTFATLGLGEHYLTDLIVALPFVALMQALGLITVQPSRRELRLSALRSVLVFALSLALIWTGPHWLRGASAAWALVLLLVAHFAWEIKRQNAAMEDPSHNPEASIR